MAQLLTGAPVAEALCARLKEGVAQLKSREVTPTVAIVRVGERPCRLSGKSPASFQDPSDVRP